MLRLHYTGESVVVSNDIGEAVLRYARALAETQASDIVAIPVVEEDGVVARAKFLLGPASQLYSTPVAADGELAVDDEVVADLDLRTRRLHPSALITSDAPDATEFDSA